MLGISLLFKPFFQTKRLSYCTHLNKPSIIRVELSCNRTLQNCSVFLALAPELPCRQHRHPVWGGISESTVILNLVQIYTTSIRELHAQYAQISNTLEGSQAYSWKPPASQKVFTNHRPGHGGAHPGEEEHGEKRGGRRCGGEGDSLHTSSPITIFLQFRRSNLCNIPWFFLQNPMTDSAYTHLMILLESSRGRSRNSV